MTDTAPVRLLLVDDEAALREPLAEYLSRQGFAVTQAASAADARSQLRDETPDLVLLDIMMPGEDGLSLCRHLVETRAIPTIFLTARGEATDRIVGLEIGADDYVVKPFEPRELVARIRSVLRRASRGAPPPAEDEMFEFEGWQLDPLKRRLIDPEGAVVAISSVEFRLLMAFLEHPRQVLDRDRLLDMVQGREAHLFDRAVDNQVSRLRRKIEVDSRNPQLIQTVWGGGYMLATDVRPDHSVTIRLWPRSLIGQMLLAVAFALLLVQGFGALLVYKAQAERQEVALVHGAAFRILGELRGEELYPIRKRRHDDRRRGLRVVHSNEAPFPATVPRDREAEAQLREILFEQGLEVDQVMVVRRMIRDDDDAWRRAQRRAAFRGEHGPDPETQMLVAAVHLGGAKPEWLVARIQSPWREMDLIFPLLWQTLLIYLVVVGVIALVLRRITRPLAALTGRLDRFAKFQTDDGQLEPEGPDDVRRLIIAHNAMEDRITALLDEKDVMLGAIGHDLKTPLAALRVRIESVEDETERTRMAATIEDIVRTLDDILSLARVGRPRDPLEQSELSALVAAVVEEYEDMGEPVELGETRRIALPLRATWLRRALWNLIGNALRYGARARVSVAREGEQAVIRIEDDGPGIPDADIAAMLEPFTRGDPSRNSETGGAGLGLTLARAIAEQHGGSLSVANRRNADGSVAGLVATLSLPLS